MQVTTTMLAFASAVAVSVIQPTVAAAQDPDEPERLGAVGQTIVTSELALDYDHAVTSIDGEDEVTTTTYDFHAGFDRIAYPHVTLGARIGFAGVVSGLDGRKAFDIGGRVGGLVPIGRSTIWWPSAGLSYGLTSYESRSDTASVRLVTVNLSAPFMWQPARHLLIGVGPTYVKDLRAKIGPDADQQGPKTSSFGVHGFLGLWF